MTLSDLERLDGPHFALFHTMRQVLEPTTIDIVGRENELELRKLITEVNNSHFVLIGDFNYPDIDWISHTVNPGATAETHRFLDCLDDNFVTQHVIEPTRYEAVLDLVMTRDPDLIGTVSVMKPLADSDHNMLFIINWRLPIMSKKCANTRRRTMIKSEVSWQT